MMKLLHGVNEEALCIELELCGIPFSRQHNFDIDYKSRKVGKGRIDLLVEDVLVVELKTVESFTPLHFAQTISYLKATKKKLALLINFNVPVLKEGIKRVILSWKIFTAKIPGEKIVNSKKLYTSTIFKHKTSLRLGGY